MQRAKDASNMVKNSNTDEEKPLRGGKAPRVNTIHWERERCSSRGCILSVSNVNLTLSS